MHNLTQSFAKCRPDTTMHARKWIDYAENMRVAPIINKVNMSLLHRIFLASLLSLISMLAGAQDKQDDGPFLRYQAPGVQAQWWCDGQLHSQNWQQDSQFKVAARCGFSHDITVRKASANFPVKTHFQAKKIAAISDIHGQYASMKQLLQTNGIIDTELNWIFGDGHLLIAGDVLDRGGISKTRW